MGTPRLLHTVIDATDVRGSAEFWRELLGLVYRPGDEPPAGGEPDDADWLVLTEADGTPHRRPGRAVVRPRRPVGPPVLPVPRVSGGGPARR